MIFQLNATEMLDWQEAWCFRCEHEHEMSHGPEMGDASVGCPLILASILGKDAPEFVPHTDWFCTIPANVSCSRFTPCTRCPADPPDAERRGGETRREFHDRLRAETLALPVVPA